jgi:hypothetical protein
VTGIGIASLIHQTTTSVRIAAQHQADVAAQPFEALLGRRQLARLLVERPIGERSARSLLDVLRGSHSPPSPRDAATRAGTPGNG